MPETKDLVALLDTIADPAGRGGLHSSGRASAPRISDGKASLVLDVTGLAAAERDALDRAIHAALESLPGVTEIRIARWCVARR